MVSGVMRPSFARYLGCKMAPMRGAGYWLGVVLTAAPLLAQGTAAPDAAGFTKSVQPFLARYCYTCHNAKLQTSGLNLEVLDSGPAMAAHRDESERVLRKLRAGEMPPPGIPRPPESDLKLVTTWLEREFDR